MHCPKCGSQDYHKSGFVKGRQRYQCRECPCKFTRSTAKGRPLQEKLLALQLYLSGLSLNAIAKLLGISTPGVLKWIRQFGSLAQERPYPGKATVVELDELCHILCEKNVKSGFAWLF